MSGMAKCKYCGGPIRFEDNSYTGRPVALDRQPVTNGDFSIGNGECIELGTMGKLSHTGLLYQRHSCAPRRKALGI